MKMNDLWQQRLKEALNRYTDSWDEERLTKDLRALGFYGERLKEQVEFAREVKEASLNTKIPDHLA